MKKAVLGFTKVAFIERWPSYGVTTIDRFHCTAENRNERLGDRVLVYHQGRGRVRQSPCGPGTCSLQMICSPDYRGMEGGRGGKERRRGGRRREGRRGIEGGREAREGREGREGERGGERKGEKNYGEGREKTGK